MVNVREFNDGDRLQVALGNLTGMNTGPCTIAALVRVLDTVAFRPIVTFNSATQRRSIWKNSSNNMMWETSGSSTNAALSMNQSDGWLQIVWTKTNGDSLPRAHRLIVNSSTWGHANAADLSGNDGESLTHALIGRSDSSSDSWKGRYAVLGCWTDVIGNDAFIEGLDLHLNLQNWIDVEPNALWHFNQPSILEDVNDLVGSADQTSRTGTTVVDDEDLVFDFSLDSGESTPSDGMNPMLWSSLFMGGKSA